MTFIHKIGVRTAVGLLSGFLVSTPALKADFPQVVISNGPITAKIYLPDAQKGYYRSTRFDWSGAVYSLRYEGHEFYGPWFDRLDPKIINWVHEGPEIVSGPCSALCGPVDEFEIPLGWNEAKPGGTFIKIGVGVLRRGDGDYNRYVPYEVLDSGAWSVEMKSDAVVFTQVLSDPASGFAYEYRKTVRLEADKPEMAIDHVLKNTGRRAIASSVYNHNFVVLDKQAPGPDFTFQVPFAIQTSRPPRKDLVEIRGNRVVFLRPLAGRDEVAVLIEGFGNEAKDAEVVIENKTAGAGLKITGDRPLIRSLLWSIRTVLAIEPYIAIDVPPGGEFAWTNRFAYYTLPSGR